MSDEWVTITNVQRMRVKGKIINDVTLMSPIFWPHFACLYLGISSSCPKKRVFSVCSGSVDSPPSSCVVNPSLNSSMSASCSFKSTLNDPSDESSVTARCRWPTDKRFSSLNVTRLWSNDLNKITIWNKLQKHEWNQSTFLDTNTGLISFSNIVRIWNPDLEHLKRGCLQMAFKWDLIFGSLTIWNLDK